MEQQTDSPEHKGVRHRCRECGANVPTPINTLEYDLHTLINRFGVAEILDRIGNGAYQQRVLEGDSVLKQAWSEVEIRLEKAVEAALELATLQADKGVPFWL